MWCFNIAQTLLQMSSGEIFAHEGKPMCCNADSSWGDMNEETRFPRLDLAKINTYHSIKKITILHVYGYQQQTTVPLIQKKFFFSQLTLLVKRWDKNFKLMYRILQGCALVCRPGYIWSHISFCIITHFSQRKQFQFQGPVRHACINLGAACGRGWLEKVIREINLYFYFSK